MNEFYVYGYFDPFTNLPFYIGKGKGGRLFDHLSEARLRNGVNKHKENKIRKLWELGSAPVIKIIEENITEAVAFEFEVFLIEMIGRRDLGTGPLTNLTSGGEGVVGLLRDISGENNPNYGNTGEKSCWWGRKHTEETKERIRAAQIGKVLTEEHKENLRKPKSEEGRAAIAKARLDSNYRPSEETKKRTSDSLKGRPSPMKGKTHSEESKRKLSESTKGVPKKKYACVHCDRMFAPNMLSRFHNENCKLKDE